MLSLLLLVACTQEQTSVEPPVGQQGLFRIQLKGNTANSSLSKDVIDNMRLFVFKTNDKLFEYELLNLQKDEQSISCKIKEGKWNLSMVSFVNNQLIVTPDRSKTADKLLMYEYQPRMLENNRSSDAHEIFTAFLDLPQITKDDNRNASAQIIRNVSKVEILVNRVLGDIDLSAPENRVILHHVPSKIGFTGNLLPDAIRPDTLRVPLQSPLVLQQTNNQIKGDKVTFIIPANKGDIGDITPISHKMKLSVHLKKRDGSIFKSQKEIQISARCNEVLQLNVDVNAGLDVTAAIHPWVDENHDIDISQGSLVVSKSAVEMAHIENLYVKSDEPFTLSTSGTSEWLTVEKLSPTQIKLTADVTSFTQSRKTQFRIETNKIHKVISVTQRAESNTITASSNTVILSPVHSSREIEITSSGSWKLMNALTKATMSVTTGEAGKTRVRFDRKANIHGDEICTIRNINTLEEIQVKLSSLFMTAPESMEFGGNGGTQIMPVECYGGQAFVNPSTTTDFITVGLTPAKEVKVTIPASPIEATRRGSVTISHVDDPDYRINVPVIQKENIIVTIPEFEYLTYRYFWTSADGRDLDTGTELINTGLTDRSSGQSVDNAPVGWSMRGNNIADVKEYLKWGGDNTQSGNECTFIDMQALLTPANYDRLPRFIEARVYAAWYGEKRDGNITFEIVAYKGGQMIRTGFNFENHGGEEVYKETHRKNVPAKGGSTNASNYKTNYTYVCKIVYDKIKHSAQVEIIPDAARTRTYEFKGELKK